MDCSFQLKCPTMDLIIFNDLHIWLIKRNNWPIGVHWRNYPLPGRHFSLVHSESIKFCFFCCSADDTTFIFAGNWTSAIEPQDTHTHVHTHKHTHTQHRSAVIDVISSNELTGLAGYPREKKEKSDMVRLPFTWPRLLLKKRRKTQTGTSIIFRFFSLRF